MITQKLAKTVEDEFDMAYRYYAILSTINSLKLANRELQLVAFTAVRGNITDKANREEFCKLYESTNATINNMVGPLKKLHVLKKEDRKIVVNPLIRLNFLMPLTLNIELSHGK